jgi:dienelactone hydrolase
MRRAALPLALLAAAASGSVVAARASPPPPRDHGLARAGASGGASAAPAPAAPVAPVAFPVGLRVLRLVDHSRMIRLPGGRRVPRTLVTYVRYPALGPAGATDLAGAPPASAGGPFPLIVFGHGFAVTPATYARLLRSWARAGYVVAAPVFPLANADAPGGPDESDLVNQPTDMSFVISSVLALAGPGSDPFAGLVNPTRIAVAGQSDGAVTALAAAYSRRLRDRRIGAAVILSGARMGGVGGYAFSAGGPPLLAAQGTADTINAPRFTYAFFGQAHRPKFLLRLLGAQHLPPYTRQQPQLSIVERVTLAFLDDYLKALPGAGRRLLAAGDVPRAAQLTADP